MNIYDSSNHGSLGARTFLILRYKILNEEYTQGKKLNEAVLAVELKMSRTPIREALKQLELEGLVESIPNKGVYVKGFDSRDIDDMFEIRLALEGLAISLAIERMDDMMLSTLEEIYALMELYTKRDDVEKMHELNLQYHEAIYHATKSRYFERLMKDINYYVSVTSRHSITQPERLKTALVEHKAILDAIKKKDVVQAQEKIYQHIHKTQLLVRAYYAHKK